MFRWKNKMWWKENGITYIHPMIGIPIILIIAGIAVWGIILL